MIGPLIAFTPKMRRLEEPSESDRQREDNHIRFLAAQYSLQTELYDLTLPGFWSEHGEWIPRGDYLSDSARFASQQRRRITTGFSPENMKKFQGYTKEYARFSLERLKEEMGRLQNLLK